MILDAGSKALAAERLTPRAPGLGLVRGRPELVVERLYEQHAVVTSAVPLDDPVGSRLRVIPTHACAAANLHRELLLVEEDRVVDAWAIGPRGPGATSLPVSDRVPLSTSTQEHTR
jgi:D-serine deaminase-like pyridoxal phosphate-dependent protein